MLRFFIQRLGMALPTLLLISIMVFGLIRFIPGDPALLMLGDMADAQSLADMRKRARSAAAETEPGCWR